MNYTLSNINLILYSTFCILNLITVIISKIECRTKSVTSFKGLMQIYFYSGGLALLLNILHPILTTVWLSFILIPTLLSIISIYDKNLSSTLSDGIEYFIDNFFEFASIVVDGVSYGV